MKQNKRFILLVVMVLLANCLFAGLASADVEKVYARPSTFDGSSNVTTDSFTRSVTSGDIDSDGNVKGNGDVTITLVEAGEGADVASSKDGSNVVVAYTFPKGSSESKNNKWKIETNNSSKVSLPSTISGNLVKGGTVTTKANVEKKDGTTVTISIADNEGKFDTTGAKIITFTLKAAVKAPKALTLALLPDKTFEVGNTYGFESMFSVTPDPTDADKSYTVTSSDPTVISVNGNNDLTALKEGKSTITITSKVDSKVTAKKEVEVKKASAKKPVTKIYFTAKELDFDVSKTNYENTDLGVKASNVINLTSYLKVEPEKYDTPTSITWSVDDEKIATVTAGRKNKKGEDDKPQYALVSAAKNAINGTAKVTVTMVNADGTSVTSEPIAINFKSKVSTLAKVSVSPENVSMYYIDEKTSSEKITIAAKAESDTDITSAMKWSWSTSDPSVVVFESNSNYPNGNGVSLKAAGAGKATITATADDGKVKKSATCEVTVTGTSPDLTVTDKNGDKSSTVYMHKGKTSTLKLTASKKVEWSSEDEKIATVKDGVVTIVGKGKTHIFAKSGDNVAVYGINAKQAAVKKLIVEEKKLTVKVGKTVKIEASTDENAYDQTVTFESADKSIATVTAKGKVKGVAKGKTTITAKAGKKTVTIKVTVK